MECYAAVMEADMVADMEADMVVATTSTIMTSLRKWVFWAYRLDWDTV